MTQSTEEFLAHYGIKGMRWGYRKSDPTGGNNTGGTASQSGPKLSKQEQDILAFASKNGLTPSQTREKHQPELSEKKALRVQELDKKSQALDSQIQDLRKNGYDSETIKSIPGGERLSQKGLTSSDPDFKLAYGTSKSEFLKIQESRLVNTKSLVDKEASDVRAGKLSSNQKLLIGLGAVAVVGGLAYYGNKKLGPGDIPLSQKGKAFLYDYNRTKTKQSKGLTDYDISKLGTDDLTFAPGHTFKRVSTVAESSVRASGFFASPDDSDTARYKAILPVYWKTWGLDATSGHVVSLQANQAIRAPAPKKVYDFYRNQVENDPKFRESFDINRIITGKDPLAGYKNTEDFARKNWPAYAAKLLNTGDPDLAPMIKHFTDQGYNAFVDSNDAGALANTPMRLLDGSMFKIVGTEALSAGDIKKAQDDLTAKIIKDKLAA